MTDARDRARFAKFVGPPDARGCTPWLGSRQANGYGRFWFRGETRFAHRVALLLSGRAPGANDVGMHLCNNRACVNVEHLRPGTYAENHGQVIAEGRSKLRQYREPDFLAWLQTWGIACPPP